MSPYDKYKLNGGGDADKMVKAAAPDLLADCREMWELLKVLEQTLEKIGYTKSAQGITIILANIKARHKEGA